MQWDAEDAAARAKHRDRTLRDYARRELGTYSPLYKRRFRKAGLDPRRVRTLGDLSKVAPVTWDDVAEHPNAFLLSPTQRDLMRADERRVVLSVLVGRLLRRLDKVNRDVVEPRYQPALWLLADGAPVAYTSTDLDQLAECGARVFALAELERGARLVTVTEAAAGLAHWQLVLGARRAGLSALHLGAAADPGAVAAATPSVLAGPSDGLLATLEGAKKGRHDLAGLEVLIVAGEDPGPSTRAALAGAAAAVADRTPVIVGMWAPIGARALWGECPEGPGYHTFPDFELLEVARGGAVHSRGPGHLIWSSIAWRGTVVFRLLTGSQAELVEGTCEACGRKGPMVITGSRAESGLVEALEARPEITSFFVQVRRTKDGEQARVHLALKRGTKREELFEDLDAKIGPARYVVAAKRTVDEKAKKAGSRVVGS